MELLKDYDCSILYHLGKVSVVADTLSIKLAGSLAHINTERRSIIKGAAWIDWSKVAVESD